LFASWFTYGLSGIFWLYMNKGLWFSSPRKIALTLLNVIIVGVGAILVRPSHFKPSIHINDLNSAASAFTSPEKPSMIIPAARVSRVLRAIELLLSPCRSSFSDT